MSKHINNRGEFSGKELRSADLHSDPLRQLREWLAEADELPEDDSRAMTLATVDRDGVPSARIVHLKRLDKSGVVFTSSRSQKTADLDHRPVAAVVFYWPRLQRQVRLRGRAERLSTEENLELYEGRNRGQRLALRGMPQGQPVSSRAEITDHHERLDRRTEDPVPMPDDWGGWRVAPQDVEFWQGREKRLHDRFRYQLDGPGKWLLVRLAP